MRLALRNIVASTAAAACVCVAACSGSTASIGSGGGSEGVSDAAVDTSTTSSGGPAPDAGKPDSGAIDSGGVEDAGQLFVNEKPSPQCNDLAQVASKVTPVGMLGPAPDPNPLAAITPGRYVATSITDYGGLQAVDPSPTQTTVFFTAAKQYYVHDDNKGLHQQITVSWQLKDGRLEREIVCSKDGTGNTVSNRIDASPNGFTIFVDLQGPENRVEGVRYERVQ